MNNIIRNVVIKGTGSYVPKRVLTNKQIEEMVPSTNDQWIFEKLGIKERRVVTNENTSDITSKAALNALEDAGIQASEIDLIIVATTTPDRLSPSTAALVQEKIGAGRAAAFDLAAVCSGFIYGLSLGFQLVGAGAYKRVLVIGGETFSKFTDWTRRDCVFFGDGAGAVVLERDDTKETLFHCELHADGKGYEHFTIRGGGSEFPAKSETIAENMHTYRMNGKEVFNTATTVLPSSIRSVLNYVGYTVNDVDLIVPHQPSVQILIKTAEILGIPFEKVMTNMDRFANTGAGTIPLMLDQVKKGNRIMKGNNIVFAAVGGGWTWGAAIYKWA